MQPLERQSLNQKLMSQFIKAIETDELCAGEKLPSEADLATSFRVSRNTLRETIKILEAFGIIDSMHGQGTFVSEFAKQRIPNVHFVQGMWENPSVKALMDARIVIEPGLARLAAERCTDEDIDLLQKSVSNIFHTNSRNNLTQLFHMAVAQAAHNEILYRYLQTIYLQLIGTSFPVMQEKMSKAHLEQEIVEHQQIVDQIISGDGASASHLLYLHLHTRLDLMHDPEECCI